MFLHRLIFEILTQWRIEKEVVVHMGTLRDAFEVVPRSRISATARPCTDIRCVPSQASDFRMNAQSDAIISPQRLVIE